MPRIDWLAPMFPAWCYMVSFVAAYGGLRGDDPKGIIMALMFGYLGWADDYLTHEKKKALPKESYL